MAQESGLRSGDQRIITANTPTTGYQFAGWTGDTQYLSDPSQITTIVTMGNANCTVTATDRLIPVMAPTKYVSSTGDNDNAGTVSSPWRTIEYAVANTTTPGDRIYLYNGTYNFSTKLVVPVGVSIEGQTRAGVILISSYPSSLTNTSDGSIALISGTVVNGNQSISRLTLTGNNITSKRGITVAYRNNVFIHDCTITDFKLSGVLFKGSNNDWDIEPTPYCSGSGVYNCTITNCSARITGAAQSASLYINGQSGFVLHNCDFTQNTRQSAPAGEDNNGNILGGEWFKGLQIYDNSFIKRDVENTWNFFTELWRWRGGGAIYNNIFVGAAAMDIVDVEKTTYAHGIDIHDNYFTTASGTSIAMPPNNIFAINIELRSKIDDCYIYDNYFKNVPNGIDIDFHIYSGEGYTSVSCNNLNIYSNVFENVGMTDLQNFAISLDSDGPLTDITVTNTRIYNNTIKSIGGDQNVLAGIFMQVIGDWSDIYVQNNIVVGCASPVRIQPQGSTTPANIETLVIQNNLYYACDNDNVNFIAGITYTNAIVNTGQFVADPLLTSATDYHLLSGSPAIDAGVNVGLSYTGTAPDLGAFETSV